MAGARGRTGIEGVPFVTGAIPRFGEPFVEAWWAELETLAKVYWGIAVFGTTVTLIQFLLSITGLGGEGDFDLGDADDHPSGLGILSTRAIAAFLTGFGWIGVIVHEQGWPEIYSIVAATGAGIAMLFAVLHVMQFLFRLRHSGNVDYGNCIGGEAEAYTPIPAGGGGHGKVTATVQGRFRVVNARTDDSDAIPSGTRVRIVAVADPTTLVVSADLAAPVAAGRAATAPPPE